MASGSGSGRRGGSRNRGLISDAMLRPRLNDYGEEQMSARQFYQMIRRQGASRQEARTLTQSFIDNTL